MGFGIDGESTATAGTAGENLARSALIPMVLIITLFFLWGVANNLNDILIKQFKVAFELSDLQAGLVQSAFYLGYFLFALPAGMFMRRFGYRGAVILGLLLYAAGAFLFYPAAESRTYSMFLLALFVIASGLAFLETSANPLMTVMGPSEGAAKRINLAQAFNPLGSIVGVLIGKHFILSGVEPTPQSLAAMTPGARDAFFATETAAVQMPYVVIGCVVLLWAILIAVSRFPMVANRVADSGSGLSHLRRLLHNRGFVMSVVAQFFYVGAQVCIWSYTIRYVQGTVPGTSGKAAAGYLAISLVAFMAGRFVGTAALRYVSAARLLTLFALANCVLCAVAMLLPGMIGVYALVATSFFMSIMYPTIFALGLEGMGDDERKLGSSLIVMGIVGGAVITVAMGAVSDAAGIRWSEVVPLACFAFVVVFGWRAMITGRSRVAGVLQVGGGV